MYTIDGSDPLTLGTPYTAPLRVGGDTVRVRAVAFGAQYDTVYGSWKYYGGTTQTINTDMVTGCRILSLNSAMMSNGTRTFTIGIPQGNRQTASLVLYDPAGRKIFRRDVCGYGYHTVRINTQDFGSGVHLVRLSRGKEALVRKIVY